MPTIKKLELSQETLKTLAIGGQPTQTGGNTVTVCNCDPSFGGVCPPQR